MTPDTGPAPRPTGKQQLWKSVAYWSTVIGLILAVSGIYLLLRPVPRQLAEPQDLSLAAGDRFSLTELPMGARYRLRACEHGSLLKVDMPGWSSGWVSLESNPTDDPSRDLRIDGRNGGALVLDTRTPSGRILLFRERARVSCRGEDPSDTAYRGRRLAEGLPPFECDPTLLRAMDKEALALLKADLLTPPTPSRKRAQAPSPPPLSTDQQRCLEQLESLARLPAPPAEPTPTPPTTPTTPSAPPSSTPSSSPSPANVPASSPAAP